MTTFMGKEAERRVGRRGVAVSSDAIRKSHARAIDNPIWIATPLTATMVILSKKVSRIDPDQLLRVRPEQAAPGSIDSEFRTLRRLLRNERRDMAVVIVGLKMSSPGAEPSTGTGDHDDTRVDVELRWE